MKIAAVSDLHGQLPEIPECDLLIVAGDICPDKPYKDRSWARDDVQVQADWLKEHFQPWLEKAPAKYGSVCGWGNHDFIGEKWDQGFPIDALVEVNGLKVWVTPWTPQNSLKRRWAFMKDDDDLKQYFDLIPEGLDVLVTHGPPYGYRDSISSEVKSIYAVEPLGSRSLLAALERAKPKVVICGHIHSAHGVEDRLWGYNGARTTIYNVALVDEAYRPVYGVTTFDI